MVGRHSFREEALSKGRGVAWGLLLPPLSKDRYEFLQAVCKQYGVPQVRVVEAALDALRHLGQVDRELTEALLRGDGK